MLDWTQAEIEERHRLSAEHKARQSSREKEQESDKPDNDLTKRSDFVRKSKRERNGWGW